jgi:phage shock protein PspC (stress-responsive transcriptional regulator)
MTRHRLLDYVCVLLVVCVMLAAYIIVLFVLDMTPTELWIAL